MPTLTKLSFAVLLTVVALSVTAFSQRRGGYTHRSSGSSSKRFGGTRKTVHVRGYMRKNGTYVTPYYRAAPGTVTHYPRYTYASPAYTSPSTYRSASPFTIRATPVLSTKRITTSQRVEPKPKQ